MTTTPTEKQTSARNAIHKWLRDAPGGKYIPADIMTRDVCEVLVNGEDKGRYFWQMFVEAYTPDRQEENEWGDDGDVYVVPRIVADCLAWYSEGDYGWTVEEL